LNDDQIAEIKESTAKGDAYLPEFSVDIVNESGEVIATVKKILYVRKKQR
jgi:hypothetical protein